MSDAQTLRKAPSSSWADESDDSEGDQEFAKKLAVPEGLSPRASSKAQAQKNDSGGEGLKFKGKDAEACEFWDNVTLRLDRVCLARGNPEAELCHISCPSFLLSTTSLRASVHLLISHSRK